MILARRSVRLRLTLWYAAALTLIVVFFAVGVYAVVSWRLGRHVDRQLADALSLIEQAYLEGVDELEETDRHGGVAYFQVTQGESVIYRSEAWQRGHLSAGIKAGAGSTAQRFEGPTGEPFLLRTTVMNDPTKSVTISVAISQRARHQSLMTLAVVLLVGLPAVVVLAALAGYWLAGRVLQPVRAITLKAREITAEHLGERLPVANPDDEFGQLATVFNDVLAGVRDSFERLKRFTSDASHELRTPLTAIRSVGEVALQGDLPEEQYREVIGSMLEETERLTRLLENLLTLTRADNDGVVLRRARVDAAALTRGVGELLRSLSEERGQELIVDAAAPLLVDADPDLLQQALINLLDNAVKYTPQNGLIHLSTHLSPRDEVVIEVTDSGPGIALEHQSRVFDRFYRVDKARARQTGGVGLGLALAKWAVEVNGGRIELDSNPSGGCTFRVVLPGHAALQRNGEISENRQAFDEGVRT